MIHLPPKYVVDKTLEIGTIYILQAVELIETEVLHYFIVVFIDGNDIYTVECTSQKQTKEKHFDKHNLDYSGLVCIDPDSENNLSKRTYVNCHEYYEFTKSILVEKRKNGVLDYIGKISLDHWFQIKNGIELSDYNDLPVHLLEHPEE